MFLEMQDFDFCLNLIKFFANITKFAQILPKFTNLSKFAQILPKFAQLFLPQFA